MVTGELMHPDKRSLSKPGPDNPGFGIYLHWPFCKAKCPYCDFNSHVRHKPVDQERFASAMIAELGLYADRIKGARRNVPVTSVFFGGGTPSLMQPAIVGRLLDTIADLWTVAPDAEITLEANPTSVEAEHFRGYASAGVNRVSLGVQSLYDDQLRFLGRMHSADEAKAAIKLAQKHFDRMSFDLIYAAPIKRQRPGRRNWMRPSHWQPIIYRSINSPSSRTRPSLRSIAMAGSNYRMKTHRWRFMK